MRTERTEIDLDGTTLIVESDWEPTGPDSIVINNVRVVAQEIDLQDDRMAELLAKVEALVMEGA
jgi:hypothetical protein